MVPPEVSLLPALCWAGLCSLQQALVPKWPPFLLDCVFLECEPGFIPPVFCSLTSSKGWAPNPNPTPVLWALWPSGHFTPVSPAHPSDLPDVPPFIPPLSVSLVSPVHSVCLSNFVQSSVCSFNPPLTNSRRLSGALFHLLSSPSLSLSLTDLPSRNLTDWAGNDGIPSEFTKNMRSFREKVSTCSTRGAWEWWLVVLPPGGDLAAVRHGDQQAPSTSAEDPPPCRRSAATTKIPFQHFKPIITWHVWLLPRSLAEGTRVINNNHNNNDNKWARRSCKQRRMNNFTGATCHRVRQLCTFIVISMLLITLWRDTSTG